MADIMKDKSHIYETVSASGIVYVYLDNRLVFGQQFEEHIKVNVLYDKGMPQFDVLDEPQNSCAHWKDENNYIPAIQTENNYITTLPSDSSTSASSTNACDSMIQEHMRTNGQFGDTVLPIHFHSQIGEQGPAQSVGEGVQFSNSATCPPPFINNSVSKDKSNNQNITASSSLGDDHGQVYIGGNFINQEENIEDEDVVEEPEEKDENGTQYDSRGENSEILECTKRNRSSKRLYDRAVKLKKKQKQRTKKLCSKQLQEKPKPKKGNLSSSAKALSDTIDKKAKRKSGNLKNTDRKESSVSLKIKSSCEVKKQRNLSERKPKIKKLEQEKDVKCEYCLAMFKSQQDYFDHRKVERTPYKCKLCSKVVPFKAHLIVHMRSHKKNVTEEFASLEEKAEEQSRLPSTTEMNIPDTEIQGQKIGNGIKCDICGMIMSNILILKTHTMIHTGEYAYKCCVCGEKTHSIAKHNNHLAIHLKAGRVQCKICNINFESRSELSKHQLTHDFKCNICDKVFPNKTSRVFHYKMAHKEDILKCEICGKMYSSNEELTSHLKYHRNRSKTQCTICGLFVTRLDNHMLSHNQRPDESKMYVCDQCPKQFKSKLSFQRHLRTHSEEKPYACMECPKRFARSGGLRRHMITHTQEKPFVCDICGKACSQMGNLRIHMQIHKDSPPVQCQVCGERFAYKNVLQEHMRTTHYVNMNPVDPNSYMPTAPELYYP